MMRVPHNYFPSFRLVRKSFLRIFIILLGDIYHVRLLEKFLLADNDNTNVISLPYFATADKKLVEAIQSNPIKLIVLYDGTITTIRNNNFKDYLSEEEMQKIRLGVSERIKRAKFVNFEKEKVKLEKEIIAMRDKK